MTHIVEHIYIYQFLSPFESIEFIYINDVVNVKRYIFPYFWTFVINIFMFNKCKNFFSKNDAESSRKKLDYLNMTLDINRRFITDNMLKNVKEQNFYHIKNSSCFLFKVNFLSSFVFNHIHMFTSSFIYFNNQDSILSRICH